MSEWIAKIDFSSVNKIFNLKKLFIVDVIFILAFSTNLTAATGLQRVKYNHPGLVVDLGVGLWAWPIPTDYDEDGDNDLLVSCSDKPCNGIYFFENTSGNVKLPIFKAGIYLGPAHKNIQPSYVDGELRLLSANYEICDYKKNNFTKRERIYPTPWLHQHKENRKIRANQWRYVDYDGDEIYDIIAGVGDWEDYGWDNAFDKNGNWTHGPLHGYVCFMKNLGSNHKPDYAPPIKLKADGKIIDVYGMPSPNLADFDNDGDFDLICGEFIDKFTYFANIGTRQKPLYAAGRRLVYNDRPIHMDLQMITPVAYDWDKDQDVDLIVGDEDGRVAFIENTGQIIADLPQFLPPQYFRQQAADLKFGALVTPVSFDWDSDGDEDLICGNTAGYIGFIENLDGGNPPRWAAPEYLEADGRIIRIQAGDNGSIQGPCEAKWGYTTLNVADWDADGLADIVINSIWGKVQWFKNIGSKNLPLLAAAQPLEVEWSGKPDQPAWNWWIPKGNELVTQWRTTPVVIDLNRDGLNDLVMLDHQGYLAFFERVKKNSKLILLPPQRIFQAQGQSKFLQNHKPAQDQPQEKLSPLQLNAGSAGASGRRKLCLIDWDLDGKLDLLLNSVNINFMKNVAEKEGQFVFKDMGQVDTRILAGHTTSPTTVDWDKNGIPDLLVGAEDGHFYYLKNPHEKRKTKN
ncbi:MAG: VCBS repeat-containing protein [Sedimentisphaerales bacterium]|nr:VCBS repeat-containing protein [Sedimentisphaerales bacterium]